MAIAYLGSLPPVKLLGYSLAVLHFLISWLAKCWDTIRKIGTLPFSLKKGLRPVNFMGGSSESAKRAILLFPRPGLSF